MLQLSPLYEGNFISFSSMEIIVIFSSLSSPEWQFYGWFIKYTFLQVMFLSFLCVSDIVATSKRSKIQMKKKCSFRTGEVWWPKQLAHKTLIHNGLSKQMVVFRGNINVKGLSSSYESGISIKNSHAQPHCGVYLFQHFQETVWVYGPVVSWFSL